MIYKLYNNEIEMDFNEGVHRYKVNGEYKEGVTTLINSVTSKDGLISWAANLSANTFRDNIRRVFDRTGTITDNDIENASDTARKAHTAKKDKGADTGTEVHKLIADYIALKLQGVESTIVSSNTQVQHSLNAFNHWQETYNPAYIHSEKPIYSKQYDYCGTFDCLANIKGKLTMIDFKTANPNANWKTGEVKPYPKDFIQCSAYDEAYTEEYGSGCDQYMVVYVTKTGELYVFVDEDIEETKKAWVCALTLARHNKVLNTKKLHNKS
ncbi:hypothetical protein H0W80_00165 [Candidatus Saccharibacteria bacterium]|nr:hypothetical protein [Candidatus Saccharibacteria bacterium]